VDQHRRVAHILFLHAENSAPDIDVFRFGFARILAQETIYDEVVERLAARAATIRLGDPLDAATAMGPLVSETQMKRVLDYIDIGKREGATLVAGGKGCRKSRPK
jgi:acyl-CoA reductase-like NAD-dependent aldehyde dehydrogenase